MKALLLSGVFFAMTAVILGAFAAHGLKGKLTENLLNAFKTGVEYQMYHALGILLIVLFYRQQSIGLFQWAGWSLFAGVILFSGSLYLLALTQIKWFGPITPLGGVCFILGWLLFLVGIVRHWEV